MKNKLISILLVVIALVIGLSGCSSDADVASQNISKEADNFKVTRRIVFYNGISGEYILVIEGLCSLGNYDPAGSLSVTCKTGENEYKKHFLGLSDNVTYFAEQIQSANVSQYYYSVIFKPSIIVLIVLLFARLNRVTPRHGILFCTQFEFGSRYGMLVVYRAIE